MRRTGVLTSLLAAALVVAAFAAGEALATPPLKPTVSDPIAYGTSLPLRDLPRLSR